MSDQTPRNRSKLRHVAWLPLLLGLAWGAYEWVLSSDWLLEKIEERVISEAERTTGGKAELGRVVFDRAAFAVDVEDLIIRGSDGEPFVEVPRLHLGLGLESLLGGRVFVRSMRFEEPVAKIRIQEDGSWNLPDRPEPEKEDTEELLSLTTRRFAVRDGVVEYNGEPYRFDAQADGLRLDIDRDPACDAATLQADKIDWDWKGFEGPPLETDAEVRICGDTLTIERAVLRNGGLELSLSGSAEPLTKPRVQLDFEAAGELALWLDRILGPGWGGALNASGGVEWEAGRFRYEGSMAVARGRFAGADLSVDDVSLTTRFSGAQDAADFGPLSVEALGGRFAGALHVDRPFGARRLAVEGNVEGFRLQQGFTAVGLDAAPWTAAVNAWLRAEGSSAKDWEAESILQLTGSPGDRPVSGAAALSFNTATAAVEISELDLSTDLSRLRLRGAVRPGGRSAVEVDLETFDPTDIQALTALGGLEIDENLLAIHGPVDLQGNLLARLSPGALETAEFEGSITTGPLDVAGYRWDSFTGDLELAAGLLRVSNARMVDGSGGVDFGIDLGLGDNMSLDDVRIAGDFRASDLDLTKSLAAAELPELVTGTMSGTARVGGSVSAPKLEALLTVAEGRLWKEPFDQLRLMAAAAGKQVKIESLDVRRGDQRLSGSGAFDGDSRELRIQVQARDWSLAEAELFKAWERPPQGLVDFQVGANGFLSTQPDEIFETLEAQGNWGIEELVWNGRSVGSWNGALKNEGDSVLLDLEGAPLGGVAGGQAAVRFGTAEIDGAATFSAVDPAAAMRLLGLPTANVTGEVRGSMTFAGSLLNPESITAEGSFDKLEMVVNEIPGTSVGYQLYNPFPMRWAFEDAIFQVEHMRLAGEGTNLEVDGDIPLRSDHGPIALTADGDFNLSAINSIFPDIEAAGLSTLDIQISGETSDPQINGAITVRNASLRSQDFPNGLTNLDGEIRFEGREFRIEDLTASSGGGLLTFGGVGHFREDDYDFRLTADADRVRVRFPENLSSLINGRLTLSGDESQSLLSGEIILTRVSTNAEVSLGDLLAALREPQRTPPASSLLENLQFNVSVASAADLDIETALIRDMEAGVDLRLVGSWVSPSLLGRIDISKGQMNFQGTRYTLSRGEVAFVNPFRIEPVLDFELETRIRNIDIALILAGPVRRLNISHRSDPPLTVADLVNLVALGRTPTFDPVLSSQQRIQQQSLFQTGANNVFSQAVERPVSPGLQRFFGVSRLKVDPQIGGAEANPTARISTEQQITNEVTLIYTYDVSSSNQQTVRLEYAPDRTWTFVLTRDENGLVGGDILYKTRLK